MRHLQTENPYIIGRFETGDTVTISIYDLLDDSVVVSSASMSEVGSTGYYKYYFDPSPSVLTEYLYIMTNLIEEHAGKIILGGYPDEIKDETDKIQTIDDNVDAVKLKTDNLPSDPASQSQVESAISTSESNIRGIDSDTLKTLSDQMDGIESETAKIQTIDDNVDLVLADTNEMQGKLPTNNIMGSSVKTDKDDEIDAIKLKTDNLPSDPADQSLLEAAISASESNIRGADSDDLKILSDQLDIVQADLDNPNQYKADVSALAIEANIEGHVTNSLNAYDSPTRSEATSDKNEIITEIGNVRGIDDDDLKNISDQLDIVQNDLDNPDQYKADISTLPADVWSVGVRTLTSFGTLVADIWSYVTRILTGEVDIGAVKGLAVTSVDDFKADLTTIALDIQQIKDAEKGNWKIENNQMIFYKEDLSELMRFNLFDENGDPSMTSVFQRVRV